MQNITEYNSNIMHSLHKQCITNKRYDSYLDTTLPCGTTILHSRLKKKIVRPAGRDHLTGYEAIHSHCGCKESCSQGDKAEWTTMLSFATENSDFFIVFKRRVCFKN